MQVEVKKIGCNVFIWVIGKSIENEYSICNACASSV